tara:strand:- start:1316 stop:1519 length:204 start_codon:yes stop_codon:yes gene_type:complete
MSKKITVNSDTKVVTIVKQGAQGANASETFEESGRVDGSIPVFNASLGRYVANATVTPTTLTDGGNF